MRSGHLFCYILISSFIIMGCDPATKGEHDNGKSSTPGEAVLVNQAENHQAIGLKIGQQAPDISLPDTAGDLKTLSSLRGKYILVDFWASWCGPCRFENPNVVRLHQKYQDKGFDVFSVSLDQDKKSWLKAIEADGMEWNHVSDLKKWQSAVVPTYRVDAIPMTFLLDPAGIIIARDLRGPDLEKKLASILDVKN